ncbi:MAG: F420-nonreducing hydrogenase [Sulfolobales archaeon]|nr:F420-nonreducing hydrogenase [Sulfolobales archaeon]MDW7968989.1 F420-nonreducing hydrogenase [Sulfolobales archaeon]
MSDRVKVALYWCASCGGCEEAVVDLAEELIRLSNSLEIVFWPVAVDFKKSDVEAMPDSSIDISFINGGIRLTEHEEVVKLLRRKSKLVVAFGSCAHGGGVPGLANMYSRDEILRYAYIEAPTVINSEGALPKELSGGVGGELELPKVLKLLKPLDEVVDVDFYIPGCAPTPDVIKKSLETLLSGKLPPKGSVLGASSKSLCDECDLNKTKPEKILLKDIKRVHQVRLDLSKCYLSQGVICLGPVTRGGCGTLCVKGGMPCTGCFGPLDNVSDYGARALSFLASVIDYDDEVQAEKFIEEYIPDPVGWFYRYNLPKSLIKGRYQRQGGGVHG